MREFKLLRYLKKWWWIIALCSVAGGIVFVQYAMNTQTYVAQTVLKYTNTEAELGKTPVGEDIDPSEVSSSWVITQALENAGISESVDRVRSRISISDYLPDDVEAVQKAAWAEGIEYEYFPVEYIISYNSGTNSSADEARGVLEAIMDSYYHYYGQNRLKTALAPASISALLAIEYDPIELVEALDAYVASMLTYVQDNAGYAPDYRSSLTGYSFNNLVSEYTLFQDTTLPSLYAQVIGSRVSEDKDVLILKYRARVANNNLEITNLESRAADIEQMIAAFVAKNQETMDYHWNQSSGGDLGLTRGSSYVLGQVYEFSSGNLNNERTTYDTLVLQYVSNHDQIETLKLDNVYCQYILTAFEGGAAAGDAMLEAARKSLEDACERLKRLEDVLSAGSSEYMEYRAAQNLAITSTVNVYSTMNTKLYLILAVVLFFVVGCVGAVVLGRGQDFLDYALRVDHISNLPNRRQCDAVLESFSQKPVEPPFSCFYLKVTNLVSLNMAHGYSGGTQAIAAMGRMLSLCAEDFGFVGYNDGGQFMGLFEMCSGTRVDYFLATLRSAVNVYNEEHKDAVIDYRAVSATAEPGDVNTARELLRACIAAFNQRS